MTIILKKNWLMLILVFNGFYFSQTISSADATLLSLSSMLTGLFSFKTGIKSEKLNKLKPNIKTLFKILKSENYENMKM